MKTVFRRAVAVLLVVALGPGPLPAPARADEAVAKIKKVVHDAASTGEVRLRADTRSRTADGPSIARQGLQLRRARSPRERRPISSSAPAAPGSGRTP